MEILEAAAETPEAANPADKIKTKIHKTKIQTPITPHTPQNHTKEDQDTLMGLLIPVAAVTGPKVARRLTVQIL